MRAALFLIPYHMAYEDFEIFLAILAVILVRWHWFMPLSLASSGCVLVQAHGRYDILFRTGADHALNRLAAVEQDDRWD